MRKILLVPIFLLIVMYTYGIDTLSVHSKITDVTVFFDGAQVTRTLKINLNKGKHLVKIEKLSAEINPQSIQVNNQKQGKILSVKHKLIYPEQKSKIKKSFEDKIKAKELEIQDLKNQISVFEIEEQILLNNSVFNKKEQGTSITEIKEAAVFYRQKLNEIKKSKLNLAVKISDIKDKIKDLYMEFNKKMAEENKVYSQISFVIETKTILKSSFKLSYYISSAGWSPLYDFRVSSIQEPLNIIYNANIFQSSGEDWRNVNLTLSTNKPSLSNDKPVLKPWFINRKRIYRNETKKSTEGSSMLKGKVLDVKTKEPIAFATISIYKDGKIIKGGVTDFNGRYTIKPIKSGRYNVKVAYIGYRTLSINNIILSKDRITFQDFEMSPSKAMLDEIIVKEYKAPLIYKDKKRGRIVTAEDIDKMPGRSVSPVARGGVFDDFGSSNVRGSRSDGTTVYVDGIKVRNNYFVEGYKPTNNITSLEYKITIPYTIPSDGNDYSVKVKEINLPVDYIYYTIPKLDADVFLIANIKDWNMLNLLSGKISVYYQGTYTGQSFINANSVKDTLSISLNRDKNIIVERTLLKEKNERQLIGKNIKETINWNITIRNNKTEDVKLTLVDQLPISENKSISIENIDISNGKLNKKTGKITWEINLKANEKKEILLKYSVKYPRYMRVFTE